MRYLLDTHTLYWWLYFPELLPAKVRGILSDSDITSFVSAVSAYEMSYKHHRGRWPEIAGLVGAFEQVIADEKFALLPLSARHATRAGEYSNEHRDPFDRMLAAQATVEKLTIASKDNRLRTIGAETVWE